jgi:Domain of unknown function (DUF6745)
MLNSAAMQALELHLERWAATRTTCAPADRQAAEEGIRLSYEAAGLAPPLRIIWCGGPIDIAKQLAAASADDPIGPSVKSRIFDAPRERVGTFAEIFWKEIVVAACELSGRRSVTTARNSLERAQGISRTINQAVREAAHDVLFRPSVRARYAFQRLRGLPQIMPRSTFSEIALGPDELASLGVYEYLRDVLDWQEQTEPLRGLWAVAKSASWMVPYQHVCWIAERPDKIATDARGRLHCAHGPALRYRDAWSAHAWKGVEVPAWVIEHPEWITASNIADTFEPTLRNTMIDVMTPERFIAICSPSCVSKDETGVLWRKLWGHRGVTIGSWCAVEVVNATPEPDGSQKRYVLRVPSHVRTAREAVAWTYGLTAKQYEVEVRT